MPTARYQLLPLLADQAFQRLKRNIARRGVVVPIERDENRVLLDGHHRVRATEELRKAGVKLADPPVLLCAAMSESEKRAFVQTINLYLRHLTASQRWTVVELQLAETPEKSNRAIVSVLAISPTSVGTIHRRLGEKVGTVQIGHRIGMYGRRQRLPLNRMISAGSEREVKRVLATVQAVGTAALPDRFLSAQETIAAARIAHRETSREARLTELGNTPLIPLAALTQFCTSIRLGETTGDPTPLVRLSATIGP